MTTTPEAPAWRLTDAGRFRTIEVGGWTIEDCDDMTPDGATRAPLRFYSPEGQDGSARVEGIAAARALAQGLLDACDYAERHLRDM